MKDAKEGSRHSKRLKLILEALTNEKAQRLPSSEPVNDGNEAVIW